MSDLITSIQLLGRHCVYTAEMSKLWIKRVSLRGQFTSQHASWVLNSHCSQ